MRAGHRFGWRVWPSGSGRRFLFVTDTVPVHDAEQVVDLGRIGAIMQDDHLSLRVSVCGSLMYRMQLRID
jgi:hypothetical protein